jgi:hypothetical protein
MDSFKAESPALQFSRNSSDDDDDRSSCEPGRKSSNNRGTKRAPMMSESKAGISKRKLRKNDREKQRRFELNNRFEVCEANRTLLSLFPMLGAGDEQHPKPRTE